MKNRIASLIMFVALSAAVSTANAQSEAAANPETTSAATQKAYTYRLGVEYLAIEDFNGFGLTLTENNFVFGAEVLFGETNSIVTSNWGHDLFLGWQGKHYIGDVFFVEGRVALMWRCMYSTIKESDGYDKYGKEKYKDNDDTNSYLSLVVNPRIGFKLGEKFEMGVGYRWDFNEFKFKEGYTTDYLNIFATYTF